MTISEILKAHAQADRIRDNGSYSQLAEMVLCVNAVLTRLRYPPIKPRPEDTVGARTINAYIGAAIGEPNAVIVTAQDSVQETHTRLAEFLIKRTLTEEGHG